MFDILLIGFILLNTYIGKSKGFIHMVLEMSTIFVAYFAASRFGPFVGSTFLAFFGLETVAESIISYPSFSSVNPVNLFVNSLGAALVFLVVRYGLSFLLVTTHIINKIPVVGWINRIGGIVIGFVKGIVLSTLLVWMLSFLAVPTIQNLLETSFMASQLEGVFPQLYTKLLFMIGHV
ncbi:CvpA family protein [Proteinivorax tanatarense]|uniref:CvpA family protein n=1 Tax=Proteinivorax tanatarense TaxID=1260629 RepID=A0AAU7VNP3_9FIRM